MAVVYDRGYEPGPGDPLSDVGPASPPTLDELREAMTGVAGAGWSSDASWRATPKYMLDPRPEMASLADSVVMAEDPLRELVGGVSEELMPGALVMNMMPVGWFSKIRKAKAAAKAMSPTAMSPTGKLFMHRVNSMPKKLPMLGKRELKELDALSKRAFLTGDELAKLTARRAKDKSTRFVRAVGVGSPAFLTEGGGVSVANPMSVLSPAVAGFLAKHKVGFIGTAAAAWLGLMGAGAAVEAHREAAAEKKRADIKRKTDDDIAGVDRELASLFGKTNDVEGISSIYQSQDSLNDYAVRLRQGLMRRQSLAGDASDEGTAASLKAYIDTMARVRSAARPDGGDYSAAFDAFLDERNRFDTAPGQFKTLQEMITLSNAEKLRQASQEAKP